MDVSDRRLHVQLTLEAKIAPDFSLFRAIFAFAGFVSALNPRSKRGLSLYNSSRAAPTREPPGVCLRLRSKRNATKRARPLLVGRARVALTRQLRPPALPA